MNSREKRIAVQSDRQKENTPTPEPQVIVETWMQSFVDEICTDDDFGLCLPSSKEQVQRILAHAYAPERARLEEKDRQEAAADSQIQETLKKYMADIERLQAQLEAADRLADIASEGMISSMLHRWAEKVDKAARAYLEARGKKER